MFLAAVFVNNHYLIQNFMKDDLQIYFLIIGLCATKLLRLKVV